MRYVVCTGQSIALERSSPVLLRRAVRLHKKGIGTRIDGTMRDHEIPGLNRHIVETLVENRLRLQIYLDLEVWCDVDMVVIGDVHRRNNLRFRSVAAGEKHNTSGGKRNSDTHEPVFLGDVFEPEGIATAVRAKSAQRRSQKNTISWT